MLQKSFTISDEAWQLWLDETLAKGMDDEPYKLLIIDTLMMTAGEVEENKSQDMTNKIFRPLKILSRKHNVAIIIIHHMAKSEKARPGQRMLGAVANHAWAEDSLYLSRTGGSHVRIDTESKTIPENVYRMDNVNNLQWNPMISIWGTDDKVGEETKTAEYRGYEQKKVTARDETLKLLEQGPMTTQAIAEARGVSRSAVHRQLTRHLDQGRLLRQQLPDGSNKWSLKE